MIETQDEAELKEKNFLLAVIGAKYPHVEAKLSSFWGSHDFDEYTATLFTDTRKEPREGFEFSVFVKMGELAELHNKIFNTKSNDPHMPFNNNKVYVNSNGIEIK